MEIKREEKLKGCMNVAERLTFGTTIASGLGLCFSVHDTQEVPTHRTCSPKLNNVSSVLVPRNLVVGSRPIEFRLHRNTHWACKQKVCAPVSTFPLSAVRSFPFTVANLFTVKKYIYGKEDETRAVKKSRMLAYEVDKKYNGQISISITMLAKFFIKVPSSGRAEKFILKEAARLALATVKYARPSYSSANKMVAAGVFSGTTAR